MSILKALKSIASPRVDYFPGCQIAENEGVLNAVQVFVTKNATPKMVDGCRLVWSGTIAEIAIGNSSIGIIEVHGAEISESACEVYKADYSIPRLARKKRNQQK